MLTNRMPATVSSPMRVFDRELSRLFNDWRPSEDVLTARYPVDIREDAEMLYIDAELPGFTRDQIDVTVENGALTILAHREHEKREGEVHLNERRATRVSRTFNLPDTIDENSVDASIENGVLRLVFRKREEVKPRKIEIKG
ncbi:MAG: Hsp20/alpha crystallin family protein [Phycisphaeraceae bacterium]|nr:Hsp20/alpha crystallin family protein [Phycisphaeraceae bacterium]